MVVLIEYKGMAWKCAGELLDYPEGKSFDVHYIDNGRSHIDATEMNALNIDIDDLGKLAMDAINDGK
jgi:hypothetical protein